MRFKIDENLPAEAAEILKSAGFDAHTVANEDLAGAHDRRSQAPVDQRIGFW